MSEDNGNGSGGAAPRGGRKSAILGMPCVGEMTAGAAIGLHRPSNDPALDVAVVCQASSLAAMNMNALWARALTAARTRGLDYFAMIHSDIEPGEHWLDVLIGELEAKNLDVLGVVAPIKDRRGVTSTAVARADGDNWRVSHRLTMREVYRLPETFTSADVGGPLLINTGLWVCRFNEDWCKKVHFTVNDRICFDPKRGVYFAQVEPEDWFFSRLLNELGLRVGCTRKVPLVHRGAAAFPNSEPWGEQEFDREYVARSPLDANPPADWFPHDVPGWLTEEEGRRLEELAAGKAVIEVGSYCGRSTVCLARRAKSVAAVDTFDGRATPLPGDTLPTFQRHVRRHGVEDRVSALRGESADVLAALPPIFDFAFIDGAHDRDSVARDARLAAAVLRPGGLLAFHDYGNESDPGVAEAVGELVAAGGEILERCGTLAVVRPPVQVPTFSEV